MISSKFLMLAGAILLVCSFSGCAIENNQESSNQDGGIPQSDGVNYRLGKNVAYENGKTTDQFTSGSSNELYLQIGANTGSGYVDVEIKNPAGETAYSKRISGSGQTAYSEELDGMKGTWTIEYNFNWYTGQFGVQITSD